MLFDSWAPHGYGQRSKYYEWHVDTVVLTCSMFFLRPRDQIDHWYPQLTHAHAPSETDNCLLYSSPGVLTPVPWCRPPEEICVHLSLNKYMSNIYIYIYVYIYIYNNITKCRYNTVCLCLEQKGQAIQGWINGQLNRPISSDKCLSALAPGNPH